MLRRLGLRANEKDSANTEHKTAGRDRVLIPPVEHHQETRYFKVVHRGSVGVRSSPTEPAPEDGQSFNYGDVIEVSGLAVAVPDGVVVEVKQPQGGFVYQRLGDKTILEEVDALKVIEGNWWYRVVHPAGARFVKIPSINPKAPRHSEIVPQNSIVHAIRRHTPPGSSVSFAELTDNRGWIVESAGDGTLLERAVDGKMVMEQITGDFRDESEAWYRVVAEPGVELLQGPHVEGQGLLEMFLCGKVFCASERFQPPGSTTAYVKVKNREAWLIQADGGEESCEKLLPPIDEVIKQWYRVEFAGGVRLRTSPAHDQTDPTLGVLVCGWVFLATRRFRTPGSDDIFLQVATPEGVISDVSDNDYVTENGDALANGHQERGVGQGRRESGWVPSSKNGLQVVSETEEPWIERGLFPYQVVVGESLRAKAGPHENAQHVTLLLPPYSVAAVATCFETGKGDECFVQLAGTGSWVCARKDNDVKMVSLPAFPEVDKGPRRFGIVAADGVETIVGPSSGAPGTGNILPAGTVGRSEMVWSIAGWPGNRGEGETAFALLEGMGWIKLDLENGENAATVEIEPEGSDLFANSTADGESSS